MLAELNGVMIETNDSGPTAPTSVDPDREAQFVHLNESVRAALAAGEPAISIDTKKKAVGDFKNAGRAWRPRASRRKSVC